jgi:hypothetical protein
LLEFGFREQRADRICAIDVALSNRRSLALFESRGFSIVRQVTADTVDLELAPPMWQSREASRE